MLFAENAVIGIFGRNQRPDGAFLLAVGFRDRIETALFLVGHRALCAEARQGFSRRRLRDPAHEIDADVHLILPHCRVPTRSAGTFPPKQAGLSIYHRDKALPKCHNGAIQTQFPPQSELKKRGID